ncbi:RNA 3'-terminal phosphate cyclase [Geobacter sp. SVR]|uniref:RNA 3'-terminal phosphate cyclase n=1 Tax=Geobacter sp. SVR TaxID=2495594 RepID=UPI00143F0033|nr:RNA 3'-terminal phosphate cyclase [Geobacter sp. SVR]BCS54223.1 ribosomal subunit interface protein [Geobacter sp. SVR]GCF85919.1 ribosomal subunit interface protein [Geobacter sp. SVR]
MLEIDGSYGEGGGQILRTALSLSCLTGRPFSIAHIRRQRDKPGLMPQHLAAVRAAQAISNASVEGARPGSTFLTFHPVSLRGGIFSFDIGTAGSVSLVLQTLIPPLLQAGHPSRLTLTGGTHVPGSPSMTYVTQVFTPMLHHLNAKLRLSIDGYGFYPHGGGRITAEIIPEADLKPYNPGAPSGPLRISGVSAVCNLPQAIAERQRAAALAMLAEKCGDDLHPARIEAMNVPGPGQGTFLFLRAERGGVQAGFTALGARGKPAETVGSEAATKLLRHLSSGAVLDPHLTDQVVPYLALARGESSFSTSCITRHLLTNLWVASQFLPLHYRVYGEEGQAGRVRIAPSNRA